MLRAKLLHEYLCRYVPLAESAAAWMGEHGMAGHGTMIYKQQHRQVEGIGARTDSRGKHMYDVFVCSELWYEAWLLCMRHGSCAWYEAWLLCMAHVRHGSCCCVQRALV
jgi:hypothetical protein